jgi:hypothetical protein
MPKFEAKLIIRMNRFKTITIILLLFTAGKLFSQVPDFCLSKEEYRLYTLINEYRVKQGLAIVPISSSLCYVAKIHARDLYINNPDTASCSLNSWSDNGKWTSCCHSRLTPNPSCIVNKPKELTKYPGEGHELVYWDSEELQPDTVLKFWKSVEQTRELLLNQKKWSYFNWKAIGVGMYKGYACVWVGELSDTIHEPGLCANTPGSDKLTLPVTDTQVQVVKAPTGRSYIIFGSFNNVDDASKMVEKHRKAGFKQAKIVVSDSTFRVSLADYPTQQEALDAKKKLGMEYKEAWVTKY